MQMNQLTAQIVQDGYQEFTGRKTESVDQMRLEANNIGVIYGGKL
jgi:hypothetical protein